LLYSFPANSSTKSKNNPDFSESQNPVTDSNKLNFANSEDKKSSLDNPNVTFQERDSSNPKVLSYPRTTVNPIYIAVPAVGACILVVIIIFAIYLLRQHHGTSPSLTSPFLYVEQQTADCESCTNNHLSCIGPGGGFSSQTHHLFSHTHATSLPAGQIPPPGLLLPPPGMFAGLHHAGDHPYRTGPVHHQYPMLLTSENKTLIKNPLF
jgi:hypothetical protein